MSSNSEPAHLNKHHRDTLLQIFQHPTGHNIQWQAVVSLLEAVGTVEPRHDGNYPSADPKAREPHGRRI
jgi:hypothetical protein